MGRVSLYYTFFILMLVGAVSGASGLECATTISVNDADAKLFVDGKRVQVAFPCAVPCRDVSQTIKVTSSDEQEFTRVMPPAKDFMDSDRTWNVHFLAKNYRHAHASVTSTHVQIRDAQDVKNSDYQKQILHELIEIRKLISKLAVDHPDVRPMAEELKPLAKYKSFLVDDNTPKVLKPEPVEVVRVVEVAQPKVVGPVPMPQLAVEAEPVAPVVPPPVKPAAIVEAQKTSANVVTTQDKAVVSSADKLEKIEPKVEKSKVAAAPVVATESVTPVAATVPVTSVTPVVTPAPVATVEKTVAQPVQAKERVVSSKVESAQVTAEKAKPDNIEAVVATTAPTRQVKKQEQAKKVEPKAEALPAVVESIVTWTPELPQDVSRQVAGLGGAPAIASTLLKGAYVQLYSLIRKDFDAKKVHKEMALYKSEVEGSVIRFCKWRKKGAEGPTWTRVLVGPFASVSVAKKVVGLVGRDTFAVSNLSCVEEERKEVEL